LKSDLPLHGVLVADFTRVLAGPLCSQLLADHGARVIKVEEPEKGDETRRWGPPFADGVSAYFLSINRNKESLALDLKRDGDVARRLIERADVVLDNFLPRQRAALLGDVRAINPKAVHCSISGYDADTPDADRPGYDLLAQAAAGLMWITGEPDGEPMKVGVALADVLTAHHAFGAICAALVRREGASIEVSLFGATLSSLANVAQSVLLTGQEAERYGNAHPSIVPYQLFHGSDRPFALGAGTDRHYEQLCHQVIERPELLRFPTNEARVRNREVLVPLLEAIFRTRTADHWVASCRKAAIPASLVQGVHEALQSDAGRVLVEEVEHQRIGRYEAVRNPVRLNGERLPIRSAPPELGADTERILKELGFSARSKS
jgi:crotonobetainyl-CoA:carnitine CoA-transferase CaiB-like acyl-CoA transferase